MNSVTVIRNAAEVVLVARQGERTRNGPAMQDLAVLNDAAVRIRDDLIDWIGPTSALPALPQDAHVLDAGGKTVLPGLIDSHTHLVFAGSRDEEFEQRIRGVSYQQISAQGGGINAFVL